MHGFSTLPIFLDSRLSALSSKELHHYWGLKEYLNPHDSASSKHGDLLDGHIPV